MLIFWLILLLIECGFKTLELSVLISLNFQSFLHICYIDDHDFVAFSHRLGCPSH